MAQSTWRQWQPPGVGLEDLQGAGGRLPLGSLLVSAPHSAWSY